MPSYDKEKMLRMLEEQRRGFSVLRDLMERIRGSHEAINSKLGYMRRCADSMGSTDYFEDTLAALSLEDAMALPREKVERFQRPNYGVHTTTYDDFASGIGFVYWQELNQERCRLKRLQAELQHSQKLHDERFACTRNLVEAVQDWGFNDPAQEL